MKVSRRGQSLIEVLVVTAVTGIALFAMTTSNVSQFRAQSALSRREDLTSDQLPITTAVLRLVKDLERADRVNIVNTGWGGFAPVTAPNAADIQIRYTVRPAAPPDPTYFDNGANYVWVEYRRDPLPLGTDVWYFGPGCTPKLKIARQIPIFRVIFETGIYGPPPPAPPGGAPGATSNMFDYDIWWDNGLAPPNQRTRKVFGRVTSLAFPYSDLNAGINGVGDSGTSQAPSAAVGAPPLPCP